MSKQQKHTPYYIYMASSQKSEPAIIEFSLFLLLPTHWSISLSQGSGVTVTPFSPIIW